nr:MAG TPA: hypothetical protein [Caudoviricetes sp.]
MHLSLYHILQQHSSLWVIESSFVLYGVHCWDVLHTVCGIAGLYKPCSHFAKQLTNTFFIQMTQQTF